MLDADRCERVASVLSPASVLPKRFALAGVYDFCEGLQYVAREHPGPAYARFDRLTRNFAEPGYYWFMPREAYPVYFAASHFARGVFSLLRADGSAALESASALERSGLPLYLMIANQLRYLYHLLRAEMGMAQVYRSRVELHAARVGYAWQVEMWEPAALLAHYVATDDVVELRRISHRIADLAEHVPSMWRYRELADIAAEMHKRPAHFGRRFELVIDRAPPRSFIGWSTALSAAAKYFNHGRDHARALELVERALGSMTSADRDYVTIFLQVEIQAAIAEAGLGRVESALVRLDGLLAQNAPSEHALVLGLLHDARARIALAAGLRQASTTSQRENMRWLRPTGVPILVAAAERLAQLGDEPTALGLGWAAVDVVTV